MSLSSSSSSSTGVGGGGGGTGEFGGRIGTQPITGTTGGTGGTATTWMTTGGSSPYSHYLSSGLSGLGGLGGGGGTGGSPRTGSGTSIGHSIGYTNYAGIGASYYDPSSRGGGTGGGFMGGFTGGGGAQMGRLTRPPRDDPDFKAILEELHGIRGRVDALLFGSVFLRRPEGLPEGAFVLERPPDVPGLQDTLTGIADVIERIFDLEDRLKDHLDSGDNDAYEDQIDEYLRDLEESRKTLRALKPTLQPDRLREGEVGKTDVSWLSWRRNTLGGRLHREINELLAVLDGPENNSEELRARLRASDLLMVTANAMLQSAQYLAWFTRRVLDYNEQLDEIDKDFTVTLVAQWVQDEVAKVQEHHRNCVNMRSELIQKLDARRQQRTQTQSRTQAVTGSGSSGSTTVPANILITSASGTNTYGGNNPPGNSSSSENNRDSSSGFNPGAGTAGGGNHSAPQQQLSFDSDALYQ